MAEDAACHQPEGGDDVVLLQKSFIVENKVIKDEPNTGDSSCPCLMESDTDLGGGFFPMAVWTRNVAGKMYNTLPDCDDPNNTTADWLMPYELGLNHCGPHFQGVAPFCGDGTASSPRTWTDDWMCNMQFCLVDPSNCEYSWAIPGSLFPGMSFSYLTCTTDDTPADQLQQIQAATTALQHDPLPHHCAGGYVGDAMQTDADDIEEIGR